MAITNAASTQTTVELLENKKNSSFFFKKGAISFMCVCLCGNVVWVAAAAAALNLFLFLRFQCSVFVLFCLSRRKKTVLLLMLDGPMVLLPTPPLIQ